MPNQYPAGCAVRSTPFKDNINGHTLQRYGKVIFNHVLVERFQELRKYCLTPNGNFNNITDLDRICRSFIGSQRNLHDFHVTQHVIDQGFVAYLEWMTRTNFTYNMMQTPPESYQKEVWENPEHELHLSQYRIFWSATRPTGNCTYVNASFMFMLQMLGIHPKNMELTSIGAGDTSNAYVITKKGDRLKEYIRSKNCSDSYSQHLKLRKYVSKTMLLKPGTCEVISSTHETPFPNHQYAHIKSSWPWRYYDARNGFRYMHEAGIFEFWTVRDKISYRNKDGSLGSAKIVQGDDERYFTVEVPKICWPSVAALTGVAPDPEDPNAVGWLYVQKDKSYGPNDTVVKLEGGGERLLPNTLASVYGFFIRKSEESSLSRKVRAALDAYEGRSFRSFRRPSQQSIAAVRLLRSSVGGAPSATLKLRFDSTIRDQLYALLGSLHDEDINQLNRKSSLFSMLADAVNMPRYLR